MKEAEVTVPVVDGSVTPVPAVVRELEVESITEPLLEADTAMLPKFISTVLAIDIGVMMVAVAEAVAEACAKERLEVPRTTTAAMIAFAMFFILFCF